MFESKELDAYISTIQNKGMKKKSLEKRGKLIDYNKVDMAMQNLMKEARLKEWDNYLKFGAAKVISREEAEKLVGGEGQDAQPREGEVQVGCKLLPRP